MQRDFSECKRDPEYTAAELHYATPSGARSVAGLVATDTLEERPVVVVVQRDDTTSTVPFDRVVQIVATD